MVSCFSFNRPNLEFIDEMPERKQFDYLRPYTIDRMHNVLKVEINFNGWRKARIHLYQKSTKVRSSFMRLERTLQLSPTFSTSLDSGVFNTVF